MKGLKRPIKRSDSERRVILTIAAMAIGLSLSFAKNSLSYDSYFNNLPLFSLRNKLNQSDFWSPQLKYFYFDEVSLIRAGRTDLSALDLMNILVAIDAQKPAQILVAGVIDQLTGGSAAAENLSNFLREHPHIAIGAMALQEAREHDGSLSYRMPYSADDYSIMNAEWNPNVTGIGNSTVLMPPLHELENLRDINQGFLNVFTPGIIFPKMDQVSNPKFNSLPFTMMMPFQVNYSYLFNDKEIIPLDRHGAFSINYPAPEVIDRNIIKGGQLLSPTAVQDLKGLVKPGDTVVVGLASMRGSWAEFSSPIGSVPLSHHTVSAVNTLLLKNWLRPVGSVPLLVMMSALVGGLLSIFISSSLVILILFPPIIVMVATLTAFLNFNIIFPWFYSVGCYGLAVAFVMVDRNVSYMSMSRRIREALRGTVSETEIREILSAPTTFRTEVREALVSLIFIDIVGFSLLTEQRTPEVVFRALRSCIERITLIIHRHGGTIDRTLGDGLLCYFGHSFSSGEHQKDHSDRAIECAIAIQRESVNSNLIAAKHGDPIMPLRIGINTGSVYIGDIGTKGRLDFTIVGNSVNYAKRLENACDQDCIMMSTSTLQLSQRYRATDPGFQRRLITVKHHELVFEAVEFDPLHEHREQRELLLQAYRKFLRIDRKIPRFDGRMITQLAFDTDYGRAELYDFSVTGLCLRLPQYLARGVTMKISIRGNTERIHNAIVKDNLDYLVGEVKWARIDESGFLHGLLINNLSPDKHEALFRLLASMSSDDNSAEMLVLSS